MEPETPKKKSKAASLFIIGGAVAVLFAASVAFNPYCPLRGVAGGGGAETGGEAVNFALRDLDGELVDFREATAGKAVVLKFGALWCGWCNKQSEDFQTLQDQLDPEKAVIFEVSVRGDEPVEKVREKQQSLGLRHTIVRDPENDAAAKYGVSGIPAVFVISPDGTIAYRGYYTPADKLMREVEKALEGASKEA